MSTKDYIVKIECTSDSDDELQVKSYECLGSSRLQLKMQYSRLHPWINFSKETVKDLRDLLDEFIETGEVVEPVKKAPSTIGKGFAF